MKRALPVLFAVLATLILASCATSNPFGEANPFVYAIGEEGSYVFTTTDRETVKAFADFGPLDYRRVTGCYDPYTGDMYGAVEGSFGKGTVDTALDLSGQFEKVTDTITYYIHKESGLQLYVPARGILLFSSTDVAALYKSTFLEASRTVNPDLALRILSSATGVYVYRPWKLPDFGFNLSDASTERFESIVILSDNVKYNVLFNMTAKEYAHSFITLLKAAYTTALREAGQRTDVAYLKSIILEDGSTVMLLDQEFDSSLLGNLFN